MAGLLWIGLTLLTSCGGEEFIADDARALVDGSASGGAAPTDGRTGGSGGASDSGMGGTAGVDASGGRAGAGSGAAAGSAGNASDAGQSTGPGCASLPPGDNAIFYTTMDSAGDLAQPVIGSGSNLRNGGAPAFVPALDGNGLSIDEQNEWVAFAQLTATTQNINPQRGSIDFCFRPTFDSIAEVGSPEDQNHVLFRIETPTGFLQVRKADSANAFALQVTASSIAGVRETNFPPENFSFSRGAWVRLTVTWRFNTAGLVERQVRLYADGGEVAPSGTGATGPFLMDAAAADAYFFIGGNGTAPHAAGVFDEFVVYPEPIIP